MNAQTCTVNAGVPFAMCQSEGTEWTLFGNSNAPGGAPVSLTWSVISEPAGSSVSITSPTSQSTTVTDVIVPGFYTFEISGVCPDSSGTVSNRVRYRLDEDHMSPNFASSSFEICEEGYITFSNYQSDVNYSWVAYDFPVGITINMDISDDRDSVRIWTYDFKAGGSGKIILFSQRNTCVRSDTLDVIVCNSMVADAGADVYVCGDNWVKTAEFYNPLYPDEYRFMGDCGVQTWTQLSGPSSATITYDATYDTYGEGAVVWNNLTPGVYEFELEFSFGSPCNIITKDSVTFTVGLGNNECQNFIASRRVLTICNGTDSIYIDLINDFDLDPDLIRSGDSIIWSKKNDSSCDNIPDPPPPGTTFWAFSSENFCNICSYYVDYICEEGCYDRVEIQIGVQEIDLMGYDRYICTPDGSPVTLQDTDAIYQYDYYNSCTGNVNIDYRVLSSPNLTTNLNYNLRSQVPPLELGVHVFEVELGTSGAYPYNIPNSCRETGIATVYVQGQPPAVNAGTDAILPCLQDSVVLSGNDPDLPIDLNIEATWSILSGPSGATISDIHNNSPTVSNLAADGTYLFKYTIGNNACGFFEDTVKVIVSSQPPSIPNVGQDSTLCYVECIKLYAEPLAPGVLGTWSVSPSSGVTFGDINNPNSMVCGLSSNTIYTFTLDVVNGCGSNSNQVIIETSGIQGQTANAGNDICDLSNVSDTLSAEALIVGATGNWNVVKSLGNINANSVVINDPGDPSSIFIYDNEYGSIIFEWEVTIPNCGVTKDTVIFTNSYFTPPVENVSFCNGPGTYSYTLNSNILHGWILDTINYAGPAGAEILTAAGESPAQFYLPIEGKYIFYMKTGYATCSNKNTININVTSSLPTADAGPDQLDCIDFSWQMSATPGPYGGTWNLISGPTNNYNISDLEDPNASISVPQGGTYLWAWSLYPSDGSASGCVTSDTMRIDIQPRSFSIGLNRSFCSFQPVNVEGPYVEDGTMTWSISGPMTPDIVELSNPNLIRISGFNLPGTYTVTYDILVTNCVSESSSIDITFAMPIADAGVDAIACVDTANLSAVIPDAGASIQWTAIQGTGSFLNGSELNAVAQYYPILYGDTVLFEYCLTQNGCLNCDTTQVIGGFIPNPSLMYTNISSCNGSDGKITITGLAPGSMYDLFYNKDGIQQGPISITSDITGAFTLNSLDAANYSDIFVQNSLGCNSITLDKVPLAGTCTQSIGNFVWEDLNGNGIQDQGELGVDGVVVYIFEDINGDGSPDSSTPIDSVLTSNGGFYQFYDIFEGSYILEFNTSLLPTSYTFTIPNSTSDTTDSDVNLSGFTETITILAGIDDLSIDAGLLEDLLPLTMSYFTLEKENCNQIHLKWATTSEKNNSHFIVEHLVDGISFEEIGRINGNGTKITESKYSFTHYGTKNIINYYRLKSIDFNGAAEFSTVISVKIQCDKLIKSIFPNPSSSSINIQLSEFVFWDNTELYVSDLLGRNLIKESIPGDQIKENQLNINLSNLPDGIYLVKLKNGSLYTNAYKIVKIDNR